VVGADNSYSVGAQGGASSVTLTTSNLPSHTHDGGTYSAGSAGAHTHSYNRYSGTDRVDNDEVHQRLSGTTSDNTSSSGAHTHSISGSSGSAGSSATNANLPPYYALCYIMKS